MHSDLSNGVTNIDSVTKFDQYVQKAKECGMNALGFSEHGSLFEWWHKKCAIEDAGMKYIHGVEAYLTETLDTKIRDNYHCVLMARNYDGFLELNELVSRSFNRKDNHFYYVPRISFEELFSTSENIIFTSACIGGVLCKAPKEVQERFVGFMQTHKDRCFLEIGHHPDEKQVAYNRKLQDLHLTTGIPLIAGTDTHVLNAEHERGRAILQASKDISFEGEDKWDLKFKSFDELKNAYKKQSALEEYVYMEAIENTNRLADMIEPFELDRNTKYPHIYKDPEAVFEKKVYEAIETHPYALKNHTREELENRVRSEVDVYKATKSIDFMLLQTYQREWEKKNGIECGYSRGSVSGSMVAYLLGITQMDSIRFNLNFFRFMNPSRVTNADIDSDYGGADRDRVKQFLLRDKLNLDSIHSAEIITFNTIAVKGAVRDVCRALYKNSPKVDYLGLSDQINRLYENDEVAARLQYPDVFEYVDIVSGTIVSIGTHPSGVLISDLPIQQTVGLCTVSTSEYPVSMINMKELDDLMYVKLDILGLDNIGIINDTCRTLGIEQLNPDNVDLNDANVWKSIRDDTTLIFQWESNSAQKFLRKFMSDETLRIARERTKNFSMIKWLSFGNGLIRPACESFRDSVARGEFYDNGFDALNEFLAPEAGHIAMQETIMQFLVKFCGYSDAESDTVRRSIAKKKGTEKLLPEIEQRFVRYCTENYDMTEGECEEIIKPFLQVILDASAYAFSWNHSDSYSIIGYICGYLRYYHPLEFLTAALNTFSDDMEKTTSIVQYASKVGLKITPPRWGFSRAGYSFDADKRVIAKGIASIKFMNAQIADALYDLAHQNTYDRFIDLLYDIDKKTSLNTRQLDILIKLDFFADFGNQRELLKITELFYDLFKKGDVKKLSKEKIDGTPLEPIVRDYAVGVTKAGGVAKSYTVLDVRSIMRETEDVVKAAGMQDLSDVLKIQHATEVMGYMGYVSGKEEDRKKLYLLDVYELHRKSDGRKFGYNFRAKSIGSGKENNFTVLTKVYERNPVMKGDIIYCKSWGRNNRGYFSINDYERVW